MKKLSFQVIIWPLLLVTINPILLQNNWEFDSLLYDRKIQLISCENIDNQGRDNMISKEYGYELNISKNGSDNYYQHLSPIQLYKVRHKDTLSLYEEQYIKVLPVDYRLMIRLSDNHTYVQDLIKSDSSDIEICVEELSLNKFEGDQLVDEFLRGNDTLYFSVFQWHNSNSNNLVEHKFWKIKDEIYSTYDYIYSCVGPIGNGKDTIDESYLRDLSVLEESLDSISHYYPESCDNRTVSNYTFCHYRIEYRNYMKSGKLCDDEEQKLLTQSGLFRSK